MHSAWLMTVQQRSETADQTRKQRTKVEKSKSAVATQGPRKDSRKPKNRKIELRTPDGGAYLADNEPQVESSGGSKVSAYENKRREKSGEPHVMTMAARRAVCKNKAPKTTEEWSSKTYRMRMLGEANANVRHSAWNDNASKMTK